MVVSEFEVTIHSQYIVKETAELTVEGKLLLIGVLCGQVICIDGH